MNKFCLVLALTLSMLVVLHSSAEPEPQVHRPRVLVLHSYSPDYSWTREMHAGILSALQTGREQAIYRVEYMDAKHDSSPRTIAQLLQLYRVKYTGVKFDGVILTDNPALDLVAGHRNELFPRTPIVACGINDPQSIPAHAGDMNIIIERGAHKETLGAALAQNPGTREVFAIVDDSLTGQAIRRDFMEHVPQLGNRVELEILPSMTLYELTQFAKARTRDQLIYLLPYFQDSTGRVFDSDELPSIISANSPVPVYVGWDFQLGSGAVGGCVVSAFGHGHKAARTLLERLAGEPPPAVYDDLKGTDRHVYDFNVLQRFDISIANLPEGSTILNKPVSYFEAHRSAIIAALGVISLLSVYIVLLVQNVRKQRKINSKNSEILALNGVVIKTQSDLLFTLGEVIETRSHETANHVRRVAEYSVLLARKYGLHDSEVGLLRAASPMHDVGKIGIPESILQKPGQLTPEEFETMKHHTVIGYTILGETYGELLPRARTIAIQHHERWDGSGYPCGLKEDEISILARITTLADVYDALSHDRVYKKAWPRERVLAYVQEQRGLMFDPQLVDLFFNNLSEVDAIELRLSDSRHQPEANIYGPCVCPTLDESRK